MKPVNPNYMEQNSKYISTQLNKPHAFHEQINIMQNASSLEKDEEWNVTCAPPPPGSVLDFGEINNINSQHFILCFVGISLPATVLCKVKPV